MTNLAVTHIIYFEEMPERAPLSGTESHLLDLTRGLAQTGVRVEVIALLRRRTQRLDNLFLEFDRAGVMVTQIHLGDIFTEWNLFRTLYRFCRDRRERIIHTHLPLASFYGRIAALMARCIGVVDTQHNDNPADASGWRQVKWLILNMFAQQTIAISDNVRDFLINRVGLNAPNIETIHYGIKAPDVLMPREDARGALNIPQGDFCVGFVGKLTRQKNIPLLFDAVKDLKDVTLCIVGSGEEEQYLRKRAVESGANNVVFAGASDRAADYMTAFDLMVLPSRWEGFGLALLEAMIRHVPVAGSRNGAIPETLGYGKRGFLFDKPEELRAIIQTIKQDPFAATDKKVVAYQDVLSEYTVQAMVDKTRRVYYKVASEPVI